MKDLLSLVLPARLENLWTFVEATREAAVKAGLPRQRVLKLEVALEEVLVNIMQYAYEGYTGEIRIACRSCGRRLFVTEIIDNGSPFNATAVAPPDLAAELDKRRIGGLGIHLMKTFVDAVSYRREGEKNILALTMSLASPELDM